MELVFFVAEAAVTAAPLPAASPLVREGGAVMMKEQNGKNYIICSIFFNSLSADRKLHNFYKKCQLLQELSFPVTQSYRI